MVKLEEQATGASRHIIERPRLTRLLDETTARVIMLVAPAGYGKTTLARQWLAKRPHVWYAARASSADTATLGTEMLGLAEKALPKVGSRFRESLHAQRGAEDSARAADFLVQDLSDWPEELWLAIDDYQFFTPHAEHIIDRIRAIPTLHLMLTSRRRPVWCISREIMYGDIFELSTSTLKMNDAEAAAVLRSGGQAAAQDVIALAAGWPAIIGLASYADRSVIRKRHELPPELHNYIAEELFASVAEGAHEKLAQLSLIPSITVRRATQLLGPDGEAVVEEGTRVGFLTDERPGVLTMHPLLREFLRGKLLDFSEERWRRAVREVIRLLISQHEWDEAFEVARRFDVPESLDDLLEASLYELLERGQRRTVSMMVEVGRLRGSREALLDLADGELAFREGFHERARRLAERASTELSNRSPLASKAFALAGNSAYFSDAISTALTSFQRARELARTREDERRAVWGLFLSALEREDESAAELLGQFEAMSGSSPDELARIQNGRLHLGTRLGTLNYGLSGAEAVAAIVAEAKDPVVRASFWHVYAAALRAAAHYSAAIEASDNALREINAFDLSFGRAHVYLVRAGALMGTGSYDEALALLDETAHAAIRNGDTYLQMSERTYRCKLYLLTGQAADAARVSEEQWSRVCSRGVFAEFLAARAVALAAQGSPRQARETLEQAEQCSRENEATALCTGVHSLFAVEDRDFESILPRVREVVSRGVLDALVFAFRLDRRLPRRVAQIPSMRAVLGDVLSLVETPRPATGARERVALSDAVENARLTDREQEVLALLAEGKTNKEIASSLFLVESTVKVHVRNVLRKLGVHTRTEAAVHALTRRRPEAGDEPSARAADQDPGSEPRA
jgi:ATP/maltotriose-dependent transcriptional regulator MalT